MTLSRPLDPCLLPPVAREMMGAIGLDDTLRIVKRWGGAPLWVPLRLTGDHPLAQEIGLEQAKKLAWQFRTDNDRGNWVLVPLCAAALRRLREDAILQAAAEGLSAPRLARANGTTDRNIRLIKARRRAAGDNPQRGLFDE